MLLRGSNEIAVYTDHHCLEIFFVGIVFPLVLQISQSLIEHEQCYMSQTFLYTAAKDIFFSLITSASCLVARVTIIVSCCHR